MAPTPIPGRSPLSQLDGNRVRRLTTTYAKKCSLFFRLEDTFNLQAPEDQHHGAPFDRESPGWT